MKNCLHAEQVVHILYVMIGIKIKHKLRDNGNKNMLYKIKVNNKPLRVLYYKRFLYSLFLTKQNALILFFNDILNTALKLDQGLNL